MASTRLPPHEVRQLLLDALLALREKLLAVRQDSSGDPLGGICNEVRRHMCDTLGHTPHEFLQVGALLGDIWRRWPHYSGDSVFPVPPSLRSSATVRQHKAGDVWVATPYSDFWNKRTAYGRARWALLAWMIAQLEETVSTAHTTGEAP